MVIEVILIILLQIVMLSEATNYLRMWNNVEYGVCILNLTTVILCDSKAKRITRIVLCGGPLSWVMVVERCA